jgi:hypothetical protein
MAKAKAEAAPKGKAKPKPKPATVKAISEASKSNAGKPTEYTIEIASYICEQVANGEKLKSIYDRPEMPKRSTVYQWLAKHEEFAEMYARAQEDRADFFADEIVEISDDEKSDPNSRRVRIDARKWTAAKLRPRRYGEKLEVGGEGGGPLKLVLVKGDDAL